MAEKRQHRRLKRRLIVKYGERDLSQSGFTADVSPTGVFIVASVIPRLDTRLHLQLFVTPEQFLYFEGEVRRHKLVPLELRTLERSGFGVRLLTPRELITSVMGQELNAPRFELVYATRVAFQQAYERELRMGAAFISTTRRISLNTEVLLSLVLEFAGNIVELEAQVVQVFPPQESADAPVGLALIFKDRARAEALLRPWLG
jgi:Tfp pilus assembly protein PilZ